VRFKGSEEDTEKFYRYWKEAANSEKNIIIQKYDCFCGTLEKKQASDISPVIRQCCWHMMRDFPVLIDGNVPLCREDLSVLKGEKNRFLQTVYFKFKNVHALFVQANARSRRSSKNRRRCDHQKKHHNTEHKHKRRA